MDHVYSETAREGTLTHDTVDNIYITTTTRNNKIITSDECEWIPTVGNLSVRVR